MNCPNLILSIYQVYAIDSWIAVQGMLALSSLIITYMRVLIREKPIPPNHISENYLCVWGIYCQQGLPGIKRNINYLQKEIIILNIIYNIYDIHRISECITHEDSLLHDSGIVRYFAGSILGLFNQLPHRHQSKFAIFQSL